MMGRRLGKHLVPEGNVDVQLGEDLSESLRGLKVGFFSSFFFSGPSCVGPPWLSALTDQFCCSPKGISSATVSRVCNSALLWSPAFLCCMCPSPASVAMTQFLPFL